jgi:hypothetical protein
MLIHCVKHQDFRRTEGFDHIRPFCAGRQLIGKSRWVVNREFSGCIHAVNIRLPPVFIQRFLCNPAGAQTGRNSKRAALEAQPFPASLLAG